MRRPVVAGNWKLNGTRKSVATLTQEIITGLGSTNDIDAILCPPFIHIAEVQELIQNSSLKLGAQNVSEQSAGAFTGEISADMLKEFSCGYAIIGHSERRTIYNESNDIIASKFKAASNAGLTPILCVGETLEQRENNQTENVIIAQLDSVINNVDIKMFDNAIIAYEPIWAIGTGKTASPSQAQDVHQLIRNRFSTINKALADKLPILYGGSVKPSNSNELFSQPDIDGGLIGGASLNSEDFLAICAAAENIA